jgi:hypothetical protein
MHRLEGDEPGGVVHVVAQAGQPLAGHAGKRRPHHGAIETELEQIERRLGASHLRLGPLHIGGSRRLVGQQGPGPGERLLGEVAIGLGPVHLGLELAVIHLEERRSLGHQRAFPHHDLDQSAVYLGPQLDGRDRLDLSSRGDRVHYGVGPDQDHLHRDRPAGASAAGPGPGIAAGSGRWSLRGASAGAEYRQDGESNCTQSPHGGSLSLKSRRPRIASSPARASRAA